MFGRKHSDRTRRMISDKKRGKQLSPEHRLKVSDALRRNRPTQEAINRGAAKRSKTWEITTPDNAVIIVKNLSAFCREHGLLDANLRNVARGLYQTSKGYKARVVPSTFDSIL